MSKKTFSHNFRKLNISQRKDIASEYFNFTEEEKKIFSEEHDLSDLSDVLIESSIGTFYVPLGLASGFVIDGKEYVIPMAIEESSVIAAASHGAMLVKAGGGFNTWASDPIMTAQIFLIDVSQDAKNKILSAEKQIRETCEKLVPNLLLRGGGFRGLEVEAIEMKNTLCVSIHLDVRDAMGANIANTVAEALTPSLKALSNGKVLMAILTNASEHRKAKASFEIPNKFFRKGSFSGEDVCQRIVIANDLAKKYPKRAVTHNKGIMNGISALTLATGNDTRAIEAAAHFYAQNKGAYQSLTSYEYKDGNLIGSLELPLPVGTVGGSISIWPWAQLSLKMLGNPDAQDLGRIAVCLGLAQNLAALLALVTEGIQSGHMKLHAAKTAYSAGARGGEIRMLASKLWSQKTLDPTIAKKLLKEMKEYGG
jgi:hydroxymethylglutaryl-CoA reductase